MWKNLKILYNSYGSFTEILKSPYFLISVIITVLSCKADIDSTWASTATSIMPSITGFSIASFAIILSVSDDATRKVLLKKEGSEASPLVKMASSISHAIVIQVLSLIFASVLLIYNQKSLLNLIINIIIGEHIFFKFIVEYIFSSLGEILFFYGLMLIVAEVLSIFRFLSLLSKCMGTPKEKDTYQNSSKKLLSIIVIFISIIIFNIINGMRKRRLFQCYFRVIGLLLTCCRL